jgi:hypothetical protein
MIVLTRVFHRNRANTYMYIISHMYTRIYIYTHTYTYIHKREESGGGEERDRKRDTL